MDRINFMGIAIDNVTLDEALSRMEKCVVENGRMYVVTPNVDHIMKLQHDERFRQAYAGAGLVTVDGTPIVKVASLYKTPLKEKIPGPDLTDAVVKMAAKKGFSVFLLGAQEGVGEQAAQNMAAKYPGFRCAGWYSPPFGFEKDPAERERIIEIVNNSGADIVVAGMGSPKTEIFLSEIYQRLNAHVSLSTGAAIDFFAGKVSRCPRWINRIGMEWFYRFLKEPKRMFKRYFIDDMKFIFLIFKYYPRKRA